MLIVVMYLRHVSAPYSRPGGLLDVDAGMLCSGVGLAHHCMGAVLPVTVVELLQMQRMGQSILTAPL